MGGPLDPVIHQATRLRIMTALQRNREARFTALRDGLRLTDGNLASHAAKLVEAGYIEERRALTRDGFEVRYRITSAGSRAFVAYVAALRELLEAADGWSAAPRDGKPLAGEGDAAQSV